uniref:Odorant receptor n=1 Tax=Helicoverpa gelotopoeon TaxID=38040 RepID=A0A8E4HTR5_HELGL|nr:olfactory receptor OR13 [Helicoverpa gelotopoeon]
MKILSDGSDLEGVEKVEDIFYINLARKSMWILDSWPKTPNESITYRYFVLSLNVATLIGGAIYLRNNTGVLPSFELGHTYITVFMNCITCSRCLMILSRKYNEVMFSFLHKIHLFHHRHKSEYAYKTHIFIHKISHFYTVYLLWLALNGLLLFNMIPFYNCYSRGMFRDVIPANATYDHAVFYSVPFDYTTKFKGYIAMTSFNCFISYTCTSYFCVVDLTISLVIFHLWGHMRLLTYHLANFKKPASVLESNENTDPIKDHSYTEEELKEVFSKLREYIRHHNLILTFSSEMSSAFGPALLAYMVFHQVSGCILLLECSQLDMKTLLRYGPLTVAIFQQLIQISVTFELLGSSNDKLIDGVYLVPWEYMDTKNRKLVYVMLRQSQRSIDLKMMSMLTVGVQTMTAILKTSFSYFVMLKTVAEEEQ